MELRLLGPLEVEAGGAVRRIRGKPAQVLALLASEPGRVVSSDRLAEALWGDNQPATARAALQVHVSQLRSLLDPDQRQAFIHTVASGYQLAVDRDVLDTQRFEDRVAAARAAANASDWGEAAKQLEEGLKLWRGAAYADLDDLVATQLEARRLESLRQEAEEELARAELELGQEMTPRLRQLVQQDPYRERRWELLMLSLYREGRQAEALRAYREAETTLGELGLTPHPSLRRLEEAILLQDPGLTGASRRPANNLPPLLDVLVGQQRQLDEVERLTRVNRFVTLTGPGGVGKTRLAVELGHRLLERFPDGVWMVRLGEISDPQQVEETVAAALGLREAGERHATDLFAAIVRYLENRRLLIVLDECEQVTTSCITCAEAVLGRCPGVQFVAASRLSVGVHGEMVYPVPPLELVSDTPDKIPSAVELFRNRAAGAGVERAADPAELEAIAEVVRTVDGLPLGIELAAAWTSILSPREIADQLADLSRFEGGSSNPTDRHHSLVASMEWSYQLLPPQCQTTLRSLSVFADQFNLGDVAAVSGQPEPAGSIRQLVRSSLLSSLAASPTTRYRLLTTVRSFAEAKLEPGEAIEFQLRHIHHTLSLVEREAGRTLGREQRSALDRLGLQRGDVQLAIGRAITAGEGELALRLAVGMAWFWYLRGHWTEGARTMREVLEKTAGTHSAVRTKALWLSAVAAGTWTAIADAEENLLEAQSESKRLGLDVDLAWSTLFLGLAKLASEKPGAKPLIEEALERFGEPIDPSGLAFATLALGLVRFRLGDLIGAMEPLDRALALYRSNEDEFGLGRALMYTGYVTRFLGNQGRRVTAFSASVKAFESVGAPGLAGHSRIGLAESFLQSNPAAAAESFRIALDEVQRAGDAGCTATAYRGMAVAAMRLGEMDRAVHLFARCLEVALGSGDLAGIPVRSVPARNRTNLATTIVRMAELAWLQGDPERTARLLGAANHWRRGAFPTPADLLLEINHLAVNARQALGDAQFDKAWKEGIHQSLADTVAQAIPAQTGLLAAL